MSNSLFKRISLPKRVPTPKLPRRQFLHTSTSCRAAVSISPADVWNWEVKGSDPRDAVVASKLADLKRILTITSSGPSRVWGCYVDLLNFLGNEKLPLEVHRSVLRKCTPSARKLRTTALQFAPGTRRIPGVHPFEARFQAIIRSIRASNQVPDIEDYHFVLDQFAAVGHHLGAMKVLAEITDVGLQKVPKTYGLCLQALCHRLTLPCPQELRQHVVKEVTRLCVDILNEMSMHNVHITSANMDLVIRVFAATVDEEGFRKLLTYAYGVDPSFPDRPPLEYWDKGQDTSMNLPVEGVSFPLLSPLPLSTEALNVVLDFYGQRESISKMVQMFEVLTTPLPPHSLTTSPPFDEEDEDDYGISNPRVSSYQPPHVQPSTTTFLLLLKWASRAGYSHLSRHYMLHAIRYEEDADRQLRMDCARKPRSELVRHRVGINRSIMVAVFGVANREKNVQLMRRVLDKATLVIKMKEGHIKYYAKVRRRWQDADQAAGIVIQGQDSQIDEAVTERSAVPEHVHASEEGTTATARTPKLVSSKPKPFSNSFFIPSSTASPSTEVPPMPYFDVDLDAPARPSSPTQKPFDIDTHLKVIRKDLQMLNDFRIHVADAIGRITERIKEQLGRRVWASKDIYLRDQGRRVLITKEDWQQIAGFRRARAMSLGRLRLSSPSLRPAHIRPGSLAASRGLKTSAFHPHTAPYSLRTCAS
ncbi:uncharacterized protein LAESUDRAFT_812885 [Laetiporus sulphureus 93-53]|uniref:Uncharacterized protein n=1 Tax=Laetiporus sulphureus 93-53 TaxID=1314785 RepID=A0A165E5Q2_9APHY|nr:uncharacterized protein LAESUDRAFT_812885 [Laetiporus sulphureus 93-53]KZT06288.1 hypothetical protein LAESUDRAFT_812885 [Laetiporus sulphureus 93-53]